MRVTLAHEVGVDAKKSKDIYDLYLVYKSPSELQLIIYMKLLFTFVDGKDASGAKVSWTKGEAAKFVSDWRTGVATAWTAKRYATYKDMYISIHVAFDTKIGNSYPGSHWQILVEKLPSGSTGKTSFVWRDQIGKKYDVQLDSMDHLKKSGLADGTQTGAIHEFGHMLGLGDEYTGDAHADHQADKKSIMNGGSTVRARHYMGVLQWAGKQIRKVHKKIDELNEKNKQRLWDKNMHTKPSGRAYV